MPLLSSKMAGKSQLTQVHVFTTWLVQRTQTRLAHMWNDSGEKAKQTEMYEKAKCKSMLREYPHPQDKKRVYTVVLGGPPQSRGSPAIWENRGENSSTCDPLEQSKQRLGVCKSLLPTRKHYACWVNSRAALQATPQYMGCAMPPVIPRHRSHLQHVCK